MAKKISGKVFTLPVLRRIAGMPGHAASKFNRCVGSRLFGTHPGNRKAVRDAFSAAAKGCK